MFDKITIFKVIQDTIIHNIDDLEKVAFELPEGVAYDPDFLYLKVRAVSAGEYWGPNKNADFFGEQELKDNYKTFLNAHVFKNHENKNVENAIGDVLDAIWNDKMKYVELLIRIDKKLAPSITRGIEKGSITDVSMGCKIKHSICSICGNKAATTKEYCDHIKFQRHKIMPDGKRVYEINIGPKFHDISVVLNGADKTAKVTSVYNENEKKTTPEEMDFTEKAASYNGYDPIEEGFTPYYKTEEFSKIASTVSNELNYFDSVPLFTKKAMTTKEQLEKIAEIKKIINGKITAIANTKINEENFKDYDDVTKLLKLFYTDYWSDDECQEIADKIKNICKDKHVDKEKVFERFLKISNIAGIDLSSLEFGKIIRKVFNRNDNLDEISKAISSMIFSNNIGDIIDYSDNVKSDFNFPLRSAIKVNVLTSGNKDKFDNISQIKKLFELNSNNKEDDFNSDFDNDLMNILKPFLESRSSHRNFFMPRIIKIIKMDKQPNFDNINHFSLPLLLKTASINNYEEYCDMAAYEAYKNAQSERDDDYYYNINKFAYTLREDDSLGSQVAEMEKTAMDKVRVRTLTAGLPLTYGYSAIQRARIDNGEDVSGFNRYVAQNPSNAYVVQAILLPPAIKKGKKYASAVGNKTTNIGKNISKFFKAAAKNDYMYIFEKDAEDISSDNIQNLDALKNKNIDEELLKVLPIDSINAIKKALILLGSGKEEETEQLLIENKLTKEDINKYLNIATEYFKMNISKEASVLSDTLYCASQDIMFNPKGSSLSALFPGNLIDGFVFSKLGQKLQGDANKKKTNNVL